MNLPAVAPGKTRLGWIGLGVMGAPMCGHLLRAGYALTIHYEDFFRPANRPLRFVRSLTDARVDRMLERVENGMRERIGIPATPICGPSGEHWSMPLPGEWLGFDVPEYAVLTSSAP